jgi:monoamine oxidase
MHKKKVVVIGSGFAGLSAACFMAKNGYEVTVLEKNSTVGGRARKFEAEGFLFDMGPSWYWMPDVFDHFFESFGKKCADYYELKRLSPSYRVYFGEDDKAGFTLVQLIETSNITGHFCNSTNDAYIDVFSCKKFDKNIVKKMILQTFQPEKIRIRCFERNAPAYLPCIQ